ncbi:hypothetical protein AB8B12_25485 [Streptomyces sp. PGLac3x]
MLSRIGVIAASLVLLGSGTATAAAELTTRTDPSAPPSATPAAGPEKNT